jgi:hypothetical protein
MDRNNGATMDAQNALTTTWVAESVAPLIGLYSGLPLSCSRMTDVSCRVNFSMHEVDSETFEFIMYVPVT